MFGEDNLVKGHKQRANIIGNIILASFAIILARLWYLQIYKGDILYRYSLENRLRKELISAPRGMVFSRNNELLIHNIPRFDAVITPQYLKNKNESIKKLSEVLNISIKDIKKTLKKNRRQARYRPVIIKKNISRREVAIIETENNKMPGVSVKTFISREYKDKEVGAHLLGYISEISQAKLPKLRKRDEYNYRLGDFIGQAGIEQQHDLFLRGTDGHEFVEVDARGRIKRHLRSDNIFQGIENKSAVPGNNIRLTIDRDMQLSAYNALEGRVGSAVAIDVKTGEVLAMVSRPSFDPAQFSRGISPAYWKSLISNENNPLRDRSIQEHYSPGSTFKPITILAALETGIIDENTEVNCSGSFRLGSRRYRCWKRHGHGKVDIQKAIRESCDIYFYKIGVKIDIDTLAKYANIFGLGEKLGIRLPRETKGLIPTKEWKKKKTGRTWQKGETLSCVIGQSYVLATPLQLAVAYSAIANGGKIYKPQLIKEIFSNSGEIVKKMKPELISSSKINKKNLDLVREGLYQVVNSKKGTAWWYRAEGTEVAGKTGTSQVIQFSGDKIFAKCEENEYRFRHHGLFTGYAPADDPKIAISVIVEHGCHGSSAASPVASSIATTYMRKYLPEKMKMYIERKKEKVKKERIAMLKRKQKLESNKKENE